MDWNCSEQFCRELCQPSECIITSAIPKPPIAALIWLYIGCVTKHLWNHRHESREQKVRVMEVLLIAHRLILHCGTVRRICCILGERLCIIVFVLLLWSDILILKHLQCLLYIMHMLVSNPLSFYSNQGLPVSSSLPHCCVEKPHA